MSTDAQQAAKKPTADLKAVLAAVQEQATATQSYAFQVVGYDDGTACLVEAAPVPVYREERPTPNADINGHLALHEGELYRCQPAVRHPDEAPRPSWVVLEPTDRIVASELLGQPARCTAYPDLTQATQAAL